MRTFAWQYLLPSMLLLLIFATILPFADPKMVLHDRHYGCDSCGQQTCGQGVCTECTSDGRSQARWWQKPENMCYAWPKDSNGHTRRKISCRKDADCHLWQVCMYIYQSEEDFINWENEEGFCVDTIRFNSIEDIKQDDDDDRNSHKSSITNSPSSSSVSIDPPQYQPKAPASPSFNESQMITARDTSKCINKKKIIVDVNKSGFGNRMVGLLSSILLAILTDRVLLLQWSPDDAKCGAKFEDIFQTYHLENNEYEAFYIWNEENRIDNYHEVLEYECWFRFDQNVDLNDYHALNNLWLFNKMNNECDVIYVSTNRYFGKLLWDFDHFKRHDYMLKLIGPQPFFQLRQCIFRLRPHIRNAADVVISKLKTYGPYMSLHMRSVYTTQDSVDSAAKCANKMLELGAVDKIFVATDFDELEKQMKGLIEPAKAMITIKKRLQTKKMARKHNKDLFDSYDIRDDMDSALEEYHIINQAEYCGASSMEFSTFSQSALMSGGCKFIDVSLGENCFVNNTKEFSMYTAPSKNLLSNPPFEWIKSDLKMDDQLKRYGGIIKRKVKHYYPCFTHKNKYAIQNFWNDAKHGRCYENAGKQTYARARRKAERAAKNE